VLVANVRSEPASAAVRVIAAVGVGTGVGMGVDAAVVAGVRRGVGTVEKMELPVIVDSPIERNWCTAGLTSASGCHGCVDSAGGAAKPGGSAGPCWRPMSVPCRYASMPGSGNGAGSFVA